MFAITLQPSTSFDTSCSNTAAENTALSQHTAEMPSEKQPLNKMVSSMPSVALYAGTATLKEEFETWKKEEEE